MWLLNVLTKKLESFPHLKPRYAIASHRWVDGAESSSQDVQMRRNLDGLGYQKIERFAAFVREHVRGIEYLWIDTCCIDKTNSQELQEAITAMFRWYEDAVVCLAFMNDVDENVAHLPQSIWFTRGWTLQELLAPPLVVFLSREWKVFGHKAQNNLGDPVLLVDWAGPRLNRDLSNITGIPESVIAQPERRRYLSVDEKMGWMSRRTTTRPEDMAYSLLGIFEVSIPLIYQEGQTAAERRLRQAIADAGRDMEDHRNISSRSNRLQPISNIPFTRDPTFVDRVELQRLEQRLESGGARVALVGLGGVGYGVRGPPCMAPLTDCRKSQLTIEYCFRIRERRPETWVLWIYAGSEARYEESLRTLARNVRIPGHATTGTAIYAQVYDWLLDVQNGSWLLVLDNADDAEFLFHPPQHDRGADSTHHGTSTSTQTRLDLLPICEHGSIIITSRYRAIASRIVDDSHIVPVPPMEHENAVTLLSGRLNYTPDQKASHDLVAALDYLPLAITQAAAYIKRREPRCSVEQYLNKLRDSKSRTRLLSASSVELRRSREATNSILFTWRISFDHVQSVRPSAADLLSLMSFYDPHNIPESLLRITDGGNSSPSESDADDEAFEDDVATLRDYGFIFIMPSGREFKMHHLVHFATQKWIACTDRYESLIARSVRNLSHVLPRFSRMTWRTWGMWYPHAKMMLDLPLSTRETRLQRSSVAEAASAFAMEKGAPREAERFAEHCRSERQDILGTKHPDTLSAMTILVLSYLTQGLFEKAEDLGVQVLALYEQTLGEAHPATLFAMSNLSQIYVALMQYAQAEVLATRVLEMCGRLFGAEHPSTVQGLQGLATLRAHQGRVAEAEGLEVRALELRRKVLGNEHPSTLYSANNLMMTYYNRGRYAESLALASQVLELSVKTLGEEHSNTLKCIEIMAYAYAGEGNYSDADRLGALVHERYEKMFGRTDLRTRQALHHRILAYRAQGKEEAARRLEVYRDS